MNTTETAVQCCVDAYYAACNLEDPKATTFTGEPWNNIRLAYRHAMPFLTSDPDAIDAFIACVSHGLVFEVFTESESAKLLYAAQTAIASRRVRLQSDRTQPRSAAAQVPSSTKVEHHQPQSDAPTAQLAAPQVPADHGANPPTCDVARGDANLPKGNPISEQVHTPPPSPLASAAPKAQFASAQGSQSTTPKTPKLRHLSVAEIDALVEAAKNPAATQQQAPPTPSLAPMTSTHPQEAAKPQLAPPQVAQVAQVPKSPLQAILDDMYAGKLPMEKAFDRIDAVLKAKEAARHTPTPSPSLASKSQLAPPQGSQLAPQQVEQVAQVVPQGTERQVAVAS